MLLFSMSIVKDLIKDYPFKYMKYFLPLLLLFTILIPISCTFTAHAQNPSNKALQNLTGIEKNNNSSSQTNQSANNNQNKTGQTEQDKAVKNVTQATNQVAKQTSEVLSNA